MPPRSIWDPADTAPGATPLGQLQRIFATELAAEPGTLFTYNQVATYLLSLVVGRVTGEPLHVVVRSLLLDRLGARELPWHTESFGFDLGFSGAHVTTETILGIAQLALDAAGGTTSRSSPTGGTTGPTRPGARCPRPIPGSARLAARVRLSYWLQREGFHGDGAFGQYAITLPARSMVIAITSEVADMQATLDAVWEFILPAVDRPSPTDGGADTELAAGLTGLGYPAARGAAGARHRPTASTSTARRRRTWRPSTPRWRSRRRPVGTPWRSGATTSGSPASPSVTATARVVDDRRRLAAARRGERRVGRTRAFAAEVRLIETPHRFTVNAVVGGEAELKWNLCR